MSAYSHTNTLTVCPLEITIGEFDLGGVLYHANYFHIFEYLRERFLKHIGFPYAELVKNGFHLAVTQSNARYLQPIRYGESISASMWISNLKRTQVTFDYRLICLDSDRLANESSTSHALVHVQNNSFRIRSFEPDFLKALETWSQMPPG